MSEHVYEFGDPVEVKIGGEWRPAFYAAFDETGDGYRDDDGPGHLVVAKGGKTRFGVHTERVKDDDIRSLPKPARGWRLPEPGDVVSVHRSDNHRTIQSLDWGRPDPIQTQDGLWWYVSSCKPVRLHDDPTPSPGPVEPKPETPEPWVSFGKDEAQRLIGNLAVAADLSEQLGSASPEVAKLKQALVAKLIDEVAVALGADR